MYNVVDLIGKVVTIRTNNGQEIICKLNGVDEDKKYLTVDRPKVVYVNQEDVVLLPFLLTSPSQELILSTREIFTLAESLELTANDYKDMIDQEVKMELQGSDSTEDK
jgi:hypothetical protein